MAFFYKHTKNVRILIFFTIFKIYKVPRLTILYSNAFDQKFKYCKALGETVLSLEDQINIHGFLLKLCVSTMYQPSVGQRKVSLVSLLKYFSKKGRKPAY